MLERVSKDFFLRLSRSGFLNTAAKKWGLIRSIGVCNFLPEHIERLESETGVKPSVNQIELHPFFNQADQRKYHEEQNITTESWSPLARANNLLQNDTLGEIANVIYGDSGETEFLRRWNDLKGKILMAGTTLLIPIEIDVSEHNEEETNIETENENNNNPTPANEE